MMRFHFLSVLSLSMTAFVPGAVSGCSSPDAPLYVIEFQADSVRFQIYDTTQGIHPSDAVKRDPNNPFLSGPPTDQAKWAISSEGGTPLGFYSWATVLAWAPSGEAQFYTANMLRDAHKKKLVPNEQLETLKSMAVAAFQSVLDNFPDSVSYLPDGKTSFRLAPLAYAEIKALDKTPSGPWVEVATPAGGTTVVRDSP